MEQNETLRHLRHFRDLTTPVGQPPQPLGEWIHSEAAKDPELLPTIGCAEPEQLEAMTAAATEYDQLPKEPGGFFQLRKDKLLVS